MITVFVKYSKTVDSGFATVDDFTVIKSKIVEVESLTDLNDMFTNITKLKILSRTKNLKQPKFPKDSIQKH